MYTRYDWKTHVAIAVSVVLGLLIAAWLLVNVVQDVTNKDKAVARYGGQFPTCVVRAENK